MLRADNAVCGTTTTGTGTLTLAACPQPPGGLDLYAWLTATGNGFVSTNAVLVSYTIIEYTDSTFANVKSTEKGIGTLTVGANLAATTLARTTVQSTVTGMNAAAATPTYSAPTAFSVGAAANTLVFVGASATDLMAFEPYVDATSTNASGYAGPLTVGISGSGACGIIQTTLKDYYFPFYWTTPMLVKRIAVMPQAAYTGGTSNLYARIYGVKTTGQPGKLLYDFGLLGTANSSLASANASITSTAAGAGIFLIPGIYFLDILASFSGGSGTPDLYGSSSIVVPSVLSCDQPANVATATPNFNLLTATSGTAGAAPDPANLTGAAVTIATRFVGFGFKAS